MSQTKTKLNMTTEEGLNDNLKQLVDEAKTFANFSIFAELEDEEQDNNKSWFHKFSGMTSLVEDEAEDKVKDIHMTFPKLVSEEGGKGERNKLEQGDLAVSTIPVISHYRTPEQQIAFLQMVSGAAARAPHANPDPIPPAPQESTDPDSDKENTPPEPATDHVTGPGS